MNLIKVDADGMDSWNEEHRPQSVMSRFEGKTLKDIFEDLKWQGSDRGKSRCPVSRVYLSCNNE